MPLSLYVAAAVFGALFVGWGLIAGADGGDADVHPGGDGGLWALVSLRSAAFGAFAFGAVGMLGRLGGWASPVADLVAAGLGAAVWVGVSVLFRQLKTSQSGSMLADAAWIGVEAELVVPFDRGGLGRIAAQVGGQAVEIAARRAAAVAHLPVDRFTRCIVDHLDSDVALVVPRDHLLTS